MGSDHARASGYFERIKQITKSNCNQSFLKISNDDVGFATSTIIISKIGLVNNVIIFFSPPAICMFVIQS